MMKKSSRRAVLGLSAAGLGFMLLARPAFSASPVVEVARSPSCGCCGAWIAHMRVEGFSVNDRLVDDLSPLKARLGVPAGLQSCHTAMVDGYVVEGHVPAREVRRLLEERPAAIGLAVPGMPAGSPGMETDGPADSYEVVLFAKDSRTVFARY